MKINELDRAKKYAYNLLRIRQRSEKELRLKLESKGCDKEIVEKIILLLKKASLVDDIKFARSWVESRSKFNPKGSLLLKKELFDKGIDKKIIDRILEEKEESEESLISRIASERLEGLKGMPELKARKKLHDFLARRGFNYEMIESVLDKAFEDRRHELS